MDHPCESCEMAESEARRWECKFLRLKDVVERMLLDDDRYGTGLDQATKIELRRILSELCPASTDATHATAGGDPSEPFLAW